MTVPTRAEDRNALGLFACCVEVLCSLTSGDHRAGSGTLVARNRVLTCGHLFDDVPNVGNISIRTISGNSYPARVLLRSSEQDGLDLAILEVDDLPDDLQPPLIRYGRISRTDPRPVTGCWAVGFPYFQERLSRAVPKRQTVQAWGYIMPGTSLRAPRRLDLITSLDPRRPERVASPWAGMSGAAVFVADESTGDVIVGVVTQHNIRAGASVLTVTPLSELDDPVRWAEWHTTLGGTIAADLREDVKAQTVGLPVNVLGSPMLEACARAGLEALGDPAPKAARKAREVVPDSDAAQVLIHRSMALMAMPPDPNPMTAGEAERLSRSPQARCFVEQVLGYELLGNLDERIDRLLQSAFGNLCDTYAALQDTTRRDSAYEGIRVWARFLASGPISESGPVLARSFQLYDPDGLVEQLKAIQQFTLEQQIGKTAVLDALEHLRGHVREAYSRISLTMLGQNRSLPMDEIYIEPAIAFREKPLTARDARRGDAEDRNESPARVPDDISVAQSNSSVPQLDPILQWRSAATQVLVTAPTGLGEHSPLQQLSPLRCVVLGDPGIGKSTLSRKLAYDGAAPDLTRQPVPFVVVLRDLATQQEREPISIVDYMTRISTTTMQMSMVSTDLLRYFLYSGDLHVIFDGLDEVVDPQNYDRITQAIGSFCLEYRAAKVTVTSRGHGFDRTRFDSFAVFQLSPFDDTRLDYYVQRWFALDTSLSAEERVSYKNDFVRQSRAAGDLRRIPLLLALMCSIFAAEGDIPSTLSEIYQKCAQLYFRDWDARRKIRTMERMSRLHDSVVFQAFSALAAEMLGDEGMARTGATRAELTGILQNFFEAGQLLQLGEEKQVAEDFSDFISGRAWLVDTIGRNSDGAILYQFTHRTFMEYFAAEHYARVLRAPRDLAVFALTSLRREGQIVVAQLVLQIRGRTQPAEISRAVELIVSVLSYTPLEQRREAADFFTSLLAAISLQRGAVEAIVRFGIATAVSLAECYRASVWTSNGYSRYESTDLFEYRSLGQACGWNVDEPTQILESLFSTSRVSAGVVTDAVKVAFADLVQHRFDMALFLPRAIVTVTAHEYGSWSECSAYWRKMLGPIMDTADHAPSGIDLDVTLTIYAAMQRRITWSELLDLHGLGAAYLKPLNPMQFDDASIGTISATRVVGRLAPNVTETQFLEAVADHSKDGLKLPLDIIRRRNEAFSIESWKATQGESVEPSMKALRGIIVLTMVYAAGQGEVRTHPLLQRLETLDTMHPFHRFIELYRGGGTKEELRDVLPPDVGPEGESLLILTAQLDDENLKPEEARFTIAGMPQGANLNDVERPYWLPSLGKRPDRLEDSLALIEDVRTPGSPYEIALVNALCELAAVSGDNTRLAATFVGDVADRLPQMLRLEAAILLAEGARRVSDRITATEYIKAAAREFSNTSASPVLGTNIVDQASRIGRLVAWKVSLRRFRPDYEELDKWLEAIGYHRRSGIKFDSAIEAIVEEFQILKKVMLASHVQNWWLRHLSAADMPRW